MHPLLSSNRWLCSDWWTGLSSSTVWSGTHCGKVSQRTTGFKIWRNDTSKKHTRTNGFSQCPNCSTLWSRRQLQEQRRTTGFVSHQKTPQPRSEKHGRCCAKHSATSQQRHSTRGKSKAPPATQLESLAEEELSHVPKFSVLLGGIITNAKRGTDQIN